MHSGKQKKIHFCYFFRDHKVCKNSSKRKTLPDFIFEKNPLAIWQFFFYLFIFFFYDVVLKIRNWFFYYFTGKIHGVGQRMDEKIRNVMRLEEKQETKQQEKLSKISKTTHIISRKKPNKFRTPKNNSSYSRKKVNFSCRNFLFFLEMRPAWRAMAIKIPSRNWSPTEKHYYSKNNPTLN